MRAYVLASGRFSGDGREREIIGQANRMVIWEAMKYAKQQGYKLFDLGGINPESTVQWERTLAEFKESFGGERKACYYYSKVNSPVLRLLLKLRRYLK
jgi:lipid II:glycine glycyltransferase (peptidoglycan interpeptide bridge formation enzyme)